MENKQIIIILVAIIIILAAAIGFMFFNPIDAKNPTKIKITSDKSLNEGDKLSVKLTDLNGTGISKEVVNVTVTDKKGKVVVDQVIKTDSKGKASLDLDLKKGKYDVNVTFEGNENYTANSTSQKLTIKEEVVEAQTVSSSSSSQSSLPEVDQVTSTGWDPKEHEVSREQVGDGRVRVNYDDGYFVVADPDGNIITKGF